MVGGGLYVIRQGKEERPSPVVSWLGNEKKETGAAISPIAQAPQTDTADDDGLILRTKGDNNVATKGYLQIVDPQTGREKWAKAWMGG